MKKLLLVVLFLCLNVPAFAGDTMTPPCTPGDTMTPPCQSATGSSIPASVTILIVKTALR